jgi:hypothetical protein
MAVTCQRAAQALHVSFDAVGHGAARQRIAALHAGEVVDELLDVFHACGQRGVA